MSIEILKNIPIPEVLLSFGILPIKSSNSTLWYSAWTREENTPSVKVDINRNRFKDFGSGEHGSVIDVVMQLMGIRVNEALIYLKSLSLDTEFESAYIPKFKNSIPRRNSGCLKITNVQTITHCALFSFSQGRRIDSRMLSEYCKQIHYTVNDKNYFGIGFLNDGGGYEIRSKYFKGGSSPKTISTINNQADELIIFEGFFDFLSYLTMKPMNEKKYDFVILNSVTNCDKITKKFLEKYEMIYLFFDNDNAGKKTTEALLKLGENIIDYSNKYEGFNDVNEWLVNRDSKVAVLNSFVSK